MRLILDNIVKKLTLKSEVECKRVEFGRDWVGIFIAILKNTVNLPANMLLWKIESGPQGLSPGVSTFYQSD
jgi:hypothetical protein